MTTMMNKQFELVIVGHLTIDIIKFGEQERRELGGPPAYAMVGPALGLKKIGIVSRVGKEFPQEYYNLLATSGLNLDGLMQNGETTQFTNIYSEDGERTQRVDAVAGGLTCNDIPATYWDTEWMHISPVIGEIESSIITEAKKRDVKVSVDVQGFVRARQAQDTQIFGCKWKDFSVHATMIDILKADIQELCQLAQKSNFQAAAEAVHQMGVPLILITRGYKGAFLSHNETLLKIPAIPPQSIVDHTGSGDVFAISFLVEYLRTHRPLWSAFFAAAGASFNIETPGPSRFPKFDKVMERLRNFLALSKNHHYTDLLLSEQGPFDCPL